jgi:serine/threonine protein kinase
LVDSFDLQPETVFAGDFRVLRPLSRGGMGSIYVVEQVSTGKQRALKLMLAQLVADATLRKRFEQEARVGALIESEHVVEVVGAGVDSTTKMPWLAMELLVGDDLSQVVAQRGPLGVPEVLVIFEQLCHAVGAAHRAGIVHRDLKPENIFLARSRRAGGEFTVKVLDFGIAKIVAEAKTSRTAPVGSPMWMAPEQTDGSKITPATDVWALGLIAFNLLVGRFFWTAANSDDTTVPQLLREILFEVLPAASARVKELQAGLTLPAGFDEWFAHSVARDPSDRFPNADQSLNQLRTVLLGASRTPRPIAPAGFPSDASLQAAQRIHGPFGTMAPSANTAPDVHGVWRVRPAAIAVVGVMATLAGAGVAGKMLADHKPGGGASPSMAMASAPAVPPDSPVTLAASVSQRSPALALSGPSSSGTANTNEGALAFPKSSASVRSHPPLPSPHIGVTDDAGTAPKEVAPCVSDEQVQKVVRFHLIHLNRSCFERVEPSKASVNINAMVTIGADGVPQTVTASGDDPSVAQCVEGHVRLWHFPAAGCTQKTAIPFRFPLR